MREFTVVGLGEVLWDLFPAGKQLGGAPANFAYITNLLGDRGVIASRVGNDALGLEAQKKLQQIGLDVSHVQHDSLRPTGTVQVQIGPDGDPQYQIAGPVAWDFLQMTTGWAELAGRADAVCFGSLAQRSIPSRKSIHDFLALMSPQSLKVFDANLRQSFYSAQVLRESLAHANVFKLNREELPVVISLLGSSFENERQAAQWLRQHFSLRLVCITKGAGGSLLVDDNTLHEHRGFKITVADTVGAGDAFTAGLVHHFLRGASLPEMNENANRIGAWVASQIGATPAPDPAFLKYLREKPAQSTNTLP